MKQWNRIWKIRKMKLDNKGNTLGVIIVGIALLGILGSLILNITYMNYQMKISDNQSKKTFYYVEKAIDEIYAGIGAEAMIAVTESYQKVLESMVTEVDEDGTKRYKVQSDENTQIMFREGFYNKMRTKYYVDDDEATKVANLLSTLRSYIATGVDNDNVDTTIEALSTTNVEFDGIVIRMSDIKVSSLTKSGYYSSITTDFVINLPNINLGFADTEVKNWDEFFKFAVVADGYQTLAKTTSSHDGPADRAIATITVNSGVTRIHGSIFAGSSSISKKNSMNVMGGSDLGIASENFICAGPISFVNSTTQFAGIGSESENKTVPYMLDNDVLQAYGLLESHESSEELRLFANSLVTNQPALVPSGTPRVNLTVEGDCIIADDLEINADNSTVRLNGNYFGYGFLAAQSLGEQVDAGTSSKYDMELNNSEGYNMDFEHEVRSAVIVNANNADVIIQPTTFEDVAILGGRAYIDLVNGSGNATYMTGESVSVKGNQKVYKAPVGTLGTAVRTNPISTQQLVNAGVATLSGANEFLFKSGKIDQIYDPNTSIPKRAGSMLYFYRKPTSGIDQTNYFYNTLTEDFESLADVKKQIEKMNVINLQVGTDLNPFVPGVFSVGIMTEVANGNLQNINPANGIGADGKLTDKFYKLIKEMRHRYSFISSKLETFPDDEEYGDLSTDGMVAKDTTIYSYFISEAKIRNFLQSKENYFVENVFNNTSIPSMEIGKLCDGVFKKSAEQLKPQIYVADNVDKAAVVISDEDGAAVRSNYGVVIATGDVEIRQNFTGIVICGGNVNITNGATLTACAPLAKFLGKYDPALQVIFGNMAGNEEDDNVVDMSALEYQNMIQFDNWRKNYSEIH